MVYKGCVVKVEKSFAIVFTTSGECLKVVKKEGLTAGKEILFIEEDIYKEKKSISKSLGMLAAVFMLFFLSVTLYTAVQRWLPMQQVAAVVSIDINPSVELEINRKNEVLRGVALNEEGNQLLDGSIVGLPVEDVVLQVVEKAKNLQYITEEKKTILISTVALKEKEETKPLEAQLEDVILEKLDEQEALQGIQLIYLKGKKEDLQKSRKEKISIGKYEVFLRAIEEKQMITVEEIKKAKIQELVEQGVGKLKTKEVLKNKPKKDEKGEKEKKIKDLFNGKDKDGAERQIKQEVKNRLKSLEKESKKRLEQSFDKNKLPAELKKLQKIESKNADKKEERHLNNDVFKEDLKKHLKKQNAVKEKIKQEKIKHKKDKDVFRKNDQKKEIETKKEKKLKDILPRIKKL